MGRRDEKRREMGEKLKDHSSFSLVVKSIKKPSIIIGFDVEAERTP